MHNVRLFLSLCMLLYIVSPAHAQPLDFVPHEARYDVGLLTTRGDVKMTGINGKTSVKLRADCAGWVSSEDFLIDLSYENGETHVVAYHFESWEEFSSGLYSFEIHEGSTFDKEKRFEGYALTPPATQKPQAFFSMQPDRAMPLPEGVFFPLAHTRAVLQKAMAGERIFSAHIFSGTDPDRALKRTNTVIGTPQTIQNADILGTLAMADYFPIQIAYYDPSSIESVPEYEVTFHLQPNGVIAYYEIDYGDFALDAHLTEIAKISPPQC